MDRQKKNSMLIKEIKKKLDWYISEASDEEYDEKAVESLQYLLDTLEPMEKGAMPDVDEAWERFWELAQEKDKLGVLGAEADEAEKAMNADVNKTEKTTSSDANNAKVEMSANANKTAKIVSFVTRHKAIVAAVFMVLVLAVSVGVQTEAVRNSGFFHWLKSDETGMQMVTSPDGLDGRISMELEEVYYEREKLPVWAKQWAEMEQLVMEDEKYEWKDICVSEYHNRKMASSNYLRREEMVTLGVIFYEEEMSMNAEIFINYEYLKGITFGQVELGVYQKKETTGEIYYCIGFFEGKQYFYVGGCDNLQELELIAEKYLQNVNKLKLK